MIRPVITICGGKWAWALLLRGIFQDQFFMEIGNCWCYIVPMEPATSSTTGRNRLSLVLRKAGDLISIDDVSAALSMPRPEASKLLARWNAQGWIKRLRRGYYAPVPIASLGQAQVLEDPWVMVPELFGACVRRWMERSGALGAY